MRRSPNISGVVIFAMDGCGAGGIYQRPDLEDVSCINEFYW